jgi:hypothetical protein
MPGSTPIYGFPYPDPSDLVANYPALGQQLAEDVETELAASGKILQVIRATDVTDRTTTSTSFVDATISVTITPQKNTSSILLLWSAQKRPANSDFVFFAITDTSNAVISQGYLGSSNQTDMQIATVLVGWASPATTSATTYKGRFRSGNGGLATLQNTIHTGQLYAIEVTA